MNKIERFKKNHRSCLADLQYVGLQAAGITALHKKLLFGGNVTLPLGDVPYTGEIDLLMNCDGLTNGAIQPDVKKFFKHEVSPVMREHFPEFRQKYTGRIKLHFREGSLTTFNLTH